MAKNVEKLVQEADALIKKGDYAQAWKLLLPHKEDENARKRLKWLKSKQEQIKLEKEIAAAPARIQASNPLLSWFWKLGWRWKLGIGFLFLCGGMILYTMFGQWVGFIPDATEQAATKIAQAEGTRQYLIEHPPTATNTPTETLTPTMTLSPTITFTPSATFTASPSPPPPPTDTPELGSRGNPYPAGEIQEVRDGRFRVNSIRTDMNAAVNQMNMFNQQPSAGQEWVLVDVSFFCDLSSEEVCNISFLQFEIVGTLGRAYNREAIVVLDNPFTGEIFGGGEITGSIGFIVDSSDSELLLVFVDFGRKFFDIP